MCAYMNLPISSEYDVYEMIGKVTGNGIGDKVVTESATD